MKNTTKRVLSLVGLFALTLGTSFAAPSMACCSHGQSMACCHGQMACCHLSHK